MLKAYENMPSAKVDLKRFESDANEFMAGILKYFEKHALGSKQERKKAMKEVMSEEF